MKSITTTYIIQIFRSLYLSFAATKIYTRLKLLYKLAKF
jgi:hypothetical protein